MNSKPRIGHSEQANAQSLLFSRKFFPIGNLLHPIGLRKTLVESLDVVALTEDLPDLNLYRGQVSTIVEVHEPIVFEVLL